MEQRLLFPVDNMASLPERHVNRRRRRESLPSSVMAASATITVLIMAVAMPTVTNALSGWSFLPNQSDCRLKCQNGGVCAFNTDDPEWHKCICFIGMFRGEQCEIAVPSDGGADDSPATAIPEADDNEVVAEEEEAEDVRQPAAAPLDVEDHGIGGIGGDFGANDDEDEMAEELNSVITTVPSSEVADSARNSVAGEGEPISYEAELVTAADGARGALVINHPSRHRRPDIDETPEMVGRAPPPFPALRTTVVFPADVPVAQQQDESVRGNEERNEEMMMTTASTGVGEQHAVIPTPPQHTDVSSASTVGGSRHFALTAADSPLGIGDGGHASTSAFADTVTASSTTSRRRVGGRTRPRRPPTVATSTTEWPTDDDEWDGGWMMSAKRSARSTGSSQRRSWSTASYGAAAALLSALTFHIFRHYFWTTVVV